MALVLGTFIIIFISCAMLGMGLVFAGRPLTGGCGKRIPGKASCNGCPNKSKNLTCRHKQNGLYKS
jgi:hypothetical protein